MFISPITDIAFNPSGWLTSPKFLEKEEMVLEESSIRIGRGQNGILAYDLRCNYGVAGSSSPPCVFCKKYPDRGTALTAALIELKNVMSAKMGDPDRCNYHPDVIAKTLKTIATARVGFVQLSLF